MCYYSVGRSEYAAAYLKQRFFMKLKVIIMSKALGSRYSIEHSPRTAEYLSAVSEVMNSSEVQSLKAFHHHRSTTRFQHCLNVSYYSFLACRKLGFDAKTAARAGMLHDLYGSTPKCTKKHLVSHPATALANARKSFSISEVEADIILKHMWPIRPGRPSYPESYVVMITDKYIAAAEICVYLKQTAQESLFSSHRRNF